MVLHGKTVGQLLPQQLFAVKIKSVMKEDVILAAYQMRATAGSMAAQVEVIVPSYTCLPLELNPGTNALPDIR